VALAVDILHNSNPVTPSDRPCANPNQPLREVGAVSSLVKTGITHLPLHTAPLDGAIRRTTRGRHPQNHVIVAHTHVRLRVARRRGSDDVRPPCTCLSTPPLHPIQCYLHPFFVYA
jgi:hypothetical protein